MPLSPPTERALRAVALRLAEARQDQAEAIAAAFRAGAAIPDIAAALGMDAFTVRDVLEREGAVERLTPKETRQRGGATAAARSGGSGPR